MGLRGRAGIGVLAVAAACAVDDGGRGGGGEDGVSGIGATAPSDDGVDEVDGDAEGGDDAPLDEGGSGGSFGGGPLFDIGDGGGGEATPTDEGCERVDFLFVIDNSASMEDQQAALVAAFPGFIAAIQATLSAEDDYQILVTDSDEWGRCDTANPWAGVDPDSDLCNGYINQTVFEECDRTLGAGVLQPAGDFATNAPCVLAGGNRWMTPAEPDLSAAFSCVAQVGVAGNPAERPMDAMVAALQPDINGQNGCNDGFLRDDALLVVTFMSDDSNYEDGGTPDSWYDAVVDAKLGDPSSIVVLGLTPAWNDCNGEVGTTNGVHWAEFVEKWGDRGVHGNICGTADDIVAFFQDAVAVIDQACDEYEPPG
jgi:hypothetical protein